MLGAAKILPLGLSMIVRGWRNVDVDGHEMFEDDEEEVGEDGALDTSSASELREATDLSKHSRENKFAWSTFLPCF
jgi:hypothetical protein